MTRSAKRGQVAAPAALSGFLPGITEPGIYAVNLPLKKPFYFSIAGGAVGGAIAENEVTYLTLHVARLADEDRA